MTRQALGRQSLPVTVHSGSTRTQCLWLSLSRGAISDTLG
jgi:hypothetical protein